MSPRAPPSSRVEEPELLVRIWILDRSERASGWTTRTTPWASALLPVSMLTVPPRPPPPASTSVPEPPLVKPLSPSSATERVAVFWLTVMAGEVVVPVPRVREAPLAEARVQFWRPEVSPKVIEPMARELLRVTVRLAVMSSEAKLADEPTPLAGKEELHLVMSLQRPSVSKSQVPLPVTTGMVMASTAESLAPVESVTVTTNCCVPSSAKPGVPESVPSAATWSQAGPETLA